MGEWIYNNSFTDNINFIDYIGFVYLIQNELTGRKYIGKKLLWFSKTSTRKNPKTGKPKKTKSKVESDWRTYYGSNLELQKDVEIHGEENFTRTILKFCKAKGELSYCELKEQVLRSVLESDEYYNGIIQVKIHKSHVPKPTE
jgi:hypothetical protein